jgi:hypothetical protein
MWLPAMSKEDSSGLFSLTSHTNVFSRWYVMVKERV